MAAQLVVDHRRRARRRQQVVLAAQRDRAERDQEAVAVLAQVDRVAAAGQHRGHAAHLRAGRCASGDLAVRRRTRSRASRIAMRPCGGRRAIALLVWMTADMRVLTPGVRNSRAAAPPRYFTLAAPRHAKTPMPRPCPDLPPPAAGACAGPGAAPRGGTPAEPLVRAWLAAQLGLRTGGASPLRARRASAGRAWTRRWPPSTSAGATAATAC